MSFSSVSWRSLFHPATSYTMVNLRAVGASGFTLHSSRCSALTARRGEAPSHLLRRVLGACRGRAAAGKGGRGDFGSDMPEVKDGEKQLSQKKELFKLGGRFLLLQKVG